VCAEPWPAPAAAALDQDEVTMVLQVNGKLRGEIVVAKDADRQAVERLARTHEAVQRYTNGQPEKIKRVVVVPGRLVNVVV